MELLDQHQFVYTIDEQITTKQKWIHVWNHEKCEFIINDLLKNNENVKEEDCIELYRKHFQLQNLSDLDKKIFKTIVKYYKNNVCTIINEKNYNKLTENNNKRKKLN